MQDPGRAAAGRGPMRVAWHATPCRGRMLAAVPVWPAARIEAPGSAVRGGTCHTRQGEQRGPCTSPLKGPPRALPPAPRRGSLLPPWRASR